jgi:hypothetical protein
MHRHCNLRFILVTFSAHLDTLRSSDVGYAAHNRQRLPALRLREKASHTRRWQPWSRGAHGLARVQGGLAVGAAHLEGRTP